MEYVARDICRLVRRYPGQPTKDEAAMSAAIPPRKICKVKKQYVNTWCSYTSISSDN